MRNNIKILKFPQCSLLKIRNLRKSLVDEEEANCILSKYFHNLVTNECLATKTSIIVKIIIQINSIQNQSNQMYQSDICTLRCLSDLCTFLRISGGRLYIQIIVSCTVYSHRQIQDDYTITKGQFVIRWSRERIVY